MKVLVTGSNGFVGKNLCVVLRLRSDVELTEFDLGTDASVCDRGLAEADVVVHLAGVNRPTDPAEFESGNVGLTEEILGALRRHGSHAKVLLASSIQAALENPYGVSKRRAEEALARHCVLSGSAGVVYRFKNLYGKWCRPNYNAVTATFCHNIARGLPVQVSDPARKVDLTYIDDVVSALEGEITGPSVSPGFRIAPALASHITTLGEMVALLESFKRQHATLLVPDFSSPFVRTLYATYLSYLEPASFEYGLTVRIDARGCLAELLKQPSFGQVFVSRTKPGITRGNHYHHTKTEKFIVVDGEAVIRFRQVLGSEVLAFHVRGSELRVVDIPPGYTHSIENVGTTEMITLFWSSEVFDPDRPDTYALPVVH